MIRKIVYVILILASLGGYVMFDGAVLLAVACFLFLLAAVLLSTLQWLRHRCRMETVTDRNTAEQGERAEVSFRMVNRSILPVPRAVVQVQVSDCSRPSKKEKRTMDISISGRSETVLSCEVPSEHSGVWKIRVRWIRLYDFLQIFFCRLPVSQAREIYIFPPLYLMHLTVKEGRGEGQSEEETDDTQKGDDPSVIFQIREYQPGDSMRNIHWKLSARTDQLMVREYGRGVIRPKVFLRLDVGSVEMEPDRMDGFRTAAASLMYTFCREKIACETVWEEGKEEQRFLIPSEEDLHEALCALVRTAGGAGGKYAAAAGTEREQAPDGAEKIQLRLDAERRLWHMEQCIAEFPPDGFDGEKWEALRIEL